MKRQKLNAEGQCVLPPEAGNASWLNRVRIPKATLGSIAALLRSVFPTTSFPFECNFCFYYRGIESTQRESAP